MPKRGGIDNLKPPIRSADEAREKGKKGGIKSGESRRQKKSMREQAQFLMQKILNDMPADLDKARLKDKVAAMGKLFDMFGLPPEESETRKNGVEIVIRDCSVKGEDDEEN